MKKLNKLVISVLLPILLVSFLWVGSFFVLAQDTSVLSMSGQGWSLKVDSSLNTALDSKSVPYVSVQKSGSEKELFLQLSSLKDCVAGQVQFKVQTQGLSVFKQLPLDKELNVSDYDFVNVTVAMRKDKVVVSRPLNVVNSFACFDGSGRKVLHIYASRLVDAKGNFVWVDSDLKGGLLTVYLDQKFLDTAVFPVVVDPSFGYTSEGASKLNTWHEGTNVVCRFQAPETGEVTDISAYVDVVGSQIELSIYSDDAGSPDALVEYKAYSPSSGTKWVTQSGFTASVTQNEYYWLGFGGAYDVGFYYDSGVTDQGADNGAYGLHQNPYVVDAWYAYKFSIYANYTASGATPTPSPSPSPSPSPTPSGTFTVVLGEADWVLFLEVVMLVACFVTLGWFNKIPLFGYLVGFFAFVVGIYVLIGGLWSSSLAIGFFGVFVGVVGGLTMLFVGLGVRVRGRR